MGACPVKSLSAGCCSIRADFIGIADIEGGSIGLYLIGLYLTGLCPIEIGAAASCGVAAARLPPGLDTARIASSATHTSQAAVAAADHGAVGPRANKELLRKGAARAGTAAGRLPRTTGSTGARPLWGR